MGILNDIKRTWDSLTPEQKFQLSKIAGTTVGTLVNKIYYSLPEDKKAEWNKKRPMHHGDIGYLVSQYGKATDNPNLLQFGKKLRETDIQDKDEWIFKDESKPVKLRKRKKK